MGTKDPRIDKYIENSADFAKPVLRHLRKTIHTGCPDVQETVKWGLPSFVHHGILCIMASFKEHCSFWFWKGRLIIPQSKLPAEKSMGNFGRITSIADLPSDKVLLGYIKKAVRLNEDGVPSPTRAKSKVKKTVLAPTYFMTALKKNKKALATFKNFAYSHRKEYVEWITQAKTEETRSKRIKTAVEWMAKGKARNWQYMKK